MAAYPMTKVSKVSRAAPYAGIEPTLTEADTVKYQRLQAATRYQVRLLHEGLTQAEADTLLAFFAANGPGPHTFTLKGRDFSGVLRNEPRELSRLGALRDFESNLVAKGV